MSIFDQIKEEESEVPKIKQKQNNITQTTEIDTEISIETQQPKAVLKQLKRPKKETSKLGITVEKDTYDKLKTLSWHTGDSVRQIVNDLLRESLEKVKIEPEYVEAFDLHFEKKRKKK